jgi:hypothetical protein
MPWLAPDQNFYPARVFIKAALRAFSSKISRLHRKDREKSKGIWKNFAPFAFFAVNFVWQQR